MAHSFAIALDIDGVLRLGPGNPIPSAGHAVSTLAAHKVPYIFLSNGSGTEQTRATQLTAELETPVTAEQLVVACTPLRCIAADLLDKPVLVVGTCSDARHFGFRKPVSVAHAARLTSALPLAHGRSYCQLLDCPAEAAAAEHADLYNDCTVTEYLKEGLAGAVVLSDCPFLPSIQVILDMVMTGGKLLSGAFNPNFDLPIVFSNPDITYSAKHSLPRLTQGALRLALDAVALGTLGRGLTYRECGKPTRATGEMAQNRVGGQVQRVYMVGDSVDSDMRMATQMGEGWRGVLVRTGLGAGVVVEELPTEKRPFMVAEDVFDAVKKIFEIENVAL